MTPRQAVRWAATGLVLSLCCAVSGRAIEQEQKVLEETPGDYSQTNNAPMQQRKTKEPRKLKEPPREQKAYDFQGEVEEVMTPRESPQYLRDSLNILDIAVAGKGIWAVTAQGAILHSPDEGNTWERQQSLTFVTAQLPNPVLRQLHFLDSDTGYAAGNFGRFLVTSDGGKSWDTRRVGDYRDDFAVMVPGSDGRPEFLCSNRPQAAESRCYRSQDGGTTWTEHATEGMRGRLFFAGLYKEGTTLAGKDGALCDGFVCWDVRLSQDFHAAAEAGARVFLGGERGFLLRAMDDKQWDTLSLRPPAKILTLAFLNERSGFSAGEHGLLYETRDAGATWIRAARRPGEGPKGEYLRFPPPGYFLCLGAIFLLLWSVIRAPREIVVKESIADQMVSDRPLEDPRLDVLGLAQKAEAIAAFLSNPKTEPPLTFGVIGDWGRGKSSLMNLLRARLERESFTTIWFNAWHHQSEEHLLASLLETIRRSPVSWWTFEGMLFRFKLGIVRLVRGRANDWLLLGVALLTLLVLWQWNPMGLQDGVGALKEVWHQVESGESPSDAPAEGEKEGEQEPAPMQEGGAFFLQLLSVGLSMFTSWRIVRKVFVVFDSKPAKLLATLAGKANLRDMSDKVGFREEFRREFHEVANSLAGHAPLIIFIDDLDRCKPEKVMEILESINFLVTCGPCYFVVAMDKRQITRAIIVHNEKAIQLFNEPAEAYAQEYLEKIINIEVPIPNPDADSYRRLLTMEGLPAAPRFRRLAPLMRNLPLFLIFGFLVYLFWSLSSQAPSGKNHPPVTAGAAVQSGPAANPESDAGDGPVVAGLPFAWDSTGTPIFQAREPAAWTRPFAVAVPALAFALFSWIVLAWIFRKQRRVFRDSSEFVQAVNTWYPLIFLGAKTPRTAKKFLNRLRFLAVLRRSPRAGGDNGLGDRDLVALASVEIAMHALADENTMTPESIKKLEAHLRTLDGKQGDGGKSFSASLSALLERRDRDVILRQFEELGTSVRVNA